MAIGRVGALGRQAKRTKKLAGFQEPHHWFIPTLEHAQSVAAASL
jgi:hypothetical protein